MQLTYTLDQSERVDKYLSTCFDIYTRNQLQKWIKDGHIRVNNKPIKSNYKLSKGDCIDIQEPEAQELDIVAQNIPIDIVYEDDQLLVVNKPRGMVVHPAAGNQDGTLVNAIMYHCKGRLSSINGVIRPGIVHRIDKDTTGLLVVCKTDIAHQSIAAQLKDHSSHRRYEALVYNNIKSDEGTIEGSIGRSPHDRKKMAIHVPNGKDAVTHYRVLERLDSNQYTYVSLNLETGRTHQIRVHMTSIGNPLIGDPIYGPSKGAFAAKGQMLHARELGFIHPTTRDYIQFNVDPPDDFMHVLNVLRKR